MQQLSPSFRLYYPSLQPGICPPYAGHSRLCGWYSEVCYDEFVRWNHAAALTAYSYRLCRDCWEVGPFARSSFVLPTQEILHNSTGGSRGIARGRRATHQLLCHRVSACPLCRKCRPHRCGLWRSSSLLLAHQGCSILGIIPHCSLMHLYGSLDLHD